MNYHNITKDDMLNGQGLRVVLWVAGCNHHCKGCQNPETWDKKGGIPFDNKAKIELLDDLKKDYISGLALSGGDPLYPTNRRELTKLCKFLKSWDVFKDKNIWCYTGYSWEDIKNLEIINYLDVIVDGEFKQELADVNYPWAGSTNQRVIDVERSLNEHRVVLLEENKCKFNY